MSSWAFISLVFFVFLGLVVLYFGLLALISLYFGCVGLHFLALWPCGSSFPCVLASWGFISFHFGFVGLHVLPVGLVLWHQANSVRKLLLTETGFLLWVPPCGNDLTLSSDNPGLQQERRAILAHAHSAHQYFCSKHPRYTHSAR